MDVQNWKKVKMDIKTVRSCQLSHGNDTIVISTPFCRELFYDKENIKLKI